MPQNDRPIGSAVQPCAVLHQFDLILKSVPPAQPVPPSWPADRRTAYPLETLSIHLGGVSPVEQQLDGAGAFHATDIPPGQAQVLFHDFFTDVRLAFVRDTRFPK